MICFSYIAVFTLSLFQSYQPYEGKSDMSVIIFISRYIKFTGEGALLSNLILCIQTKNIKESLHPSTFNLNITEILSEYRAHEKKGGTQIDIYIKTGKLGNFLNSFEQFTIYRLLDYNGDLEII